MRQRCERCGKERTKALEQFDALGADRTLKSIDPIQRPRSALLISRASQCMRTKPTPACTIFRNHKCTKIAIKTRAEILGGLP